MAVKKLQELALNCGLSKKLDGLMEAMVASLGLNYQTLIDADLFGVCDPLLLKPEKPPRLESIPLPVQYCTCKL
jgi:hypothetical protein